MKILDLPERPALAPARIDRVGDAGALPADERVAVETPVAFVYNSRSHAVMMASPTDLVDFAIGFSLAEGIVADASEIGRVTASPKGAGVALAIEVPDERAAALARRRRGLEGRTGCGLCGVADIEDVLRPLPVLAPSLPVRASAIVAALAALPAEQALNRQTGAVHAAAFAGPDGRLLCVREDVGRHSALDKLIGAMARAGADPADGFVVITSRCSMEMVQKTVTFGCPVLLAVSAPTSLALTLAEASGLAVAAFARGRRFNIYSHPERIAH